MFSLHVAEIMAFTILIAGVIAMIRYRKIDPVFLPFILCIWIASITEIVCDIIIYTYGNDGVFINIYTLLEAVLLTWQFRRWGLLKRPSWLFPALLAMLCAWWIVESSVWGTFDAEINYFQLGSSLLIAVLGLVQLNRLLQEENRTLLKNPVFLISFAFVIYFTLNVIVGLFWLYSLHLSLAFQTAFVNIITSVNCVCNLIYALAVLWMPSKQRFSMLY